MYLSIFLSILKNKTSNIIMIKYRCTISELIIRVCNRERERERERERWREREKERERERERSYVL